MLNKLLIVFFIFFQMKALADARPITYTITMDYNSVTNQFENVKATGSATVRATTTGYWPIEIRMQKDGITGLTSSEAGGGNQQIALKRTYTDFDFELHHRNNSGLKIPVRAYLDESVAFYGLTYPFYNEENHNCAAIPYSDAKLEIRATNGSGCNGKTSDYNVTSMGERFTNSSMYFGFDTLNQIKNSLRQPSYKLGDYIGSVRYTGDSVFSRVGGRMTESYTFNFVITKTKQLASFDFPSGMVTNFTVSKYGNQYIGTSELLFNVNGVFNASDKLRFSFRSANSQQGKFNLKHVTADKFIPYEVELIDLKIGRPIIFNAQNETKLISNSSENILNGKFGFNFKVNADDIISGDYSDRLTILVALDI